MYSDFLALQKQLYPTGRAFRMPAGSDAEKYHTALAKVFADTLQDALGILDALLPDNDNFTVDDATIWEKKLGIYSSSAVPLADRKLAIKRKYAHPGTIKARQHYLYIESQLRAAGFDVYVYENRFDDGMGNIISKSPYEVINVIPDSGKFHATDVYHGTDTYMGDEVDYKVANSIYDAVDALFTVPADNYSSTFFIGGSSLGDFATVDNNRRLEFRDLILRLKPLHTIAYLFVNFQ
jgi:uncharacterized protein YmfQ (DUF2313 family)